jgi:hypothetical protein
VTTRDLPDLRAGVYRHWKGRYYLVMGYAHDANAEDLYLKGDGIDGRDACKHYRVPGGERVVVIYIGLELDDAHKGPRLAVRDVDDFFLLVCSTHGTDWREACPGETTRGIRDCKGGPVHRFEYAGPSWYGWPRSAPPGASLPDELAATVDTATQPAPAGSRCPVIEPHEPHGPAHYRCPGVPPRYQTETSP